MFVFRQYIFLFLTAVIWGSGFIGQKLGMNHIGPFAFTFWRTLIGGVFLLPVILMRRRPFPPPGTGRTRLLLGSVLCGVCLIVAESLQQYGIRDSDVNRASFLTSLYVVFVPLLGMFAGHRSGRGLWLAVALAVGGLYLQCLRESFVPAFGDALLLGCAACFAVHILVIDRFVGDVDPVMLSCGQFFTASALGGLLMLAADTPDWAHLRLALPAIIYVGIMSNGVAYTLQIVGQRGVNPVIATLIMSLESVCGAVFGVLLLGERMSPREILGAALMFSAVTVAELSVSRRSRESGAASGS